LHEIAKELGMSPLWRCGNRNRQDAASDTQDRESVFKTADHWQLTGWMTKDALHIHAIRLAVVELIASFSVLFLRKNPSSFWCVVFPEKGAR
jgi:hypothetical protein